MVFLFEIMKGSMCQLTIRHTSQADVDRVMEILDIARRFMWSVGNTSQWPEGYPSRETIERDVEQGHSYVCCNGEGMTVATFCFAPGPDATYAKIEDGDWLNDRHYHVIHRIASDGSAHGVAGQIISWCRQREENLRIDTHSDNKVMQSLLESNGFVRCGIIHVADGTPRIAYQSAGKM